jgi:hypothetical protein
MTAGTIIVDKDPQSGSVMADFALKNDSAKTVHVTGTWSCDSPKP